jgi:hypothetical protein
MRVSVAVNLSGTPPDGSGKFWTQLCGSQFRILATSTEDMLPAEQILHFGQHLPWQ